VGNQILEVLNCASLFEEQTQIILWRRCYRRRKI